VHSDIPENNLNHTFTLGGRWEVLQKLYGPIDLSVELNACSLDMEKCEKARNMNIRNLCAQLKETNLIYSMLLTKITPRLMCPLNPGNYTAPRTPMDLSMFSRIPMDGHVYIPLVKIISTNPATKARIVAACFKLQLKIVKVRVQ
jgi:hypothetical protein